MKNEEVIHHNISLTFDFLKEVIKKPSLLDHLTGSETIEFVEKDRSIIENRENKPPIKFYKVRHQFDSIK